MRLVFSKNKITLLYSASSIAPIFMVLFIFFIPISSSVKSIFLVLSLAALLLTPYYRQHLLNAYFTLWGKAAVVLFAYIVIASLWSEAPWAMRLNVIDKYSKLIFLPIFAVGFIHPKTRQWALNSYLFVIFLTCILSLLKAKALITLNTPDPGEVFYNHIVTGFMVALGVYYAALLSFNLELNRCLRLFYWVLVLLGSYQIFFINTGRTGYLIYSILMSFLMIQKLSFKKAIIGVLLFMGGLVITYIESPVMHERAHLMLHDIKEQLRHNPGSTSLGYRIQFHHYARSLFAQHPVLGIGTGGFKYRFSQDQPMPQWGKKLNEPHGQYWLILAEQGLIGIVLFLFFLGTLLITALKLKESRLLLLGTLLAFCVGSFSDTIFCYSTAGYLLILISALSFGELF